MMLSKRTTAVSTTRRSKCAPARLTEFIKKCREAGERGIVSPATTQAILNRSIDSRCRHPTCLRIRSRSLIESRNEPQGVHPYEIIADDFYDRVFRRGR